MNAGYLLELTVTDLALIDRLRLSLGPGLNVLTGETGAGKSLVIDALGLVLGQRADTGDPHSPQNCRRNVRPLSARTSKTCIAVPT